MSDNWIKATTGNKDNEEALYRNIQMLFEKQEEVKQMISQNSFLELKKLVQEMLDFLKNTQMPELYALYQKMLRRLNEDDPDRGAIKNLFIDIMRILRTVPKKYLQPYQKPLLSLESVKKDFQLLVAEDNEDNRILVDLLLKRLGLSADFAFNGKEALQMIEKKSYDLLLLDMQMPVMDGFETISSLRKNPKTKNMHVIALTAYAMKKEKCLEAGCDDYLSKPFDKKIFELKINERLEKKAAL